MSQTQSAQEWNVYILKEMFGVLAENSSAYMLDGAFQGILPSLNSLSAEEASLAYQPETVTIAGHSGHILFLLDFFRAMGRGQQPNSDWEWSWRYSKVSAEEWQDLRNQIQAAFDDALGLMEQSDWSDQAAGGCLVLLSHVSYHLGQIRQLMTFVQQER
jgi:hypothetical protein